MGLGSPAGSCVAAGVVGAESVPRGPLRPVCARSRVCPHPHPTLCRCGQEVSGARHVAAAVGTGSVTTLREPARQRFTARHQRRARTASPQQASSWRLQHPAAVVSRQVPDVQSKRRWSSRSAPPLSLARGKRSSRQQKGRTGKRGVGAASATPSTRSAPRGWEVPPAAPLGKQLNTPIPREQCSYMLCGLAAHNLQFNSIYQAAALRWQPGSPAPASTSHHSVVGPAAALGHRPVDVLSGVLDVTCLRRSTTSLSRSKPCSLRTLPA